MADAAHEVMAIRSQEDVVRVRQTVRAHAGEAGLGLVDQTKLITAASELARNTLLHGGGGTVTIERVHHSPPGVRLTFEDHGPGIPDIERALQDGYTTAGGLGLGLGGSRRLVHEFSIQSTVGKGTKVVVARYRT